MQFLALCIVVLGAAINANAARPNIIFLFSDDQAVNTLGIYGNGQAKKAC